MLFRPNQFHHWLQITSIWKRLKMVASKERTPHSRLNCKISFPKVSPIKCLTFNNLGLHSQTWHHHPSVGLRHQKGARTLSFAHRHDCLFRSFTYQFLCRFFPTSNSRGLQTKLHDIHIKYEFTEGGIQQRRFKGCNKILCLLNIIFSLIALDAYTFHFRFSDCCRSYVCLFDCFIDGFLAQQ